MEKHKLFDVWSPSDSIWSPWVKPVLFAHFVERDCGVAPPVLADVDWAPPFTNRTAIVVELPGVDSVAVGMALARLGYRPVPLFNACPPPAGSGSGVIDVGSILDTLVRSTPELAQLSLPFDAPPAFLLDAHRNLPLTAPTAGSFDNRSIVFTTDFPSALFLHQQRLAAVLLVTDASRLISRDLAGVLRTWQRGDISLLHYETGQTVPPQPLQLGREWEFLGELRRRLWAWLTLRANPQGGYGNFIPESSSAG